MTDAESTKTQIAKKYAFWFALRRILGFGLIIVLVAMLVMGFSGYDSPPWLMQLMTFGFAIGFCIAMGLSVLLRRHLLKTYPDIYPKPVPFDWGLAWKSHVAIVGVFIGLGLFMILVASTLSLFGG